MLDELDVDRHRHPRRERLPDSLALTATRKSVARFLAMFQFSEADLKQRIRDFRAASGPGSRWPSAC